MRTTTVLSDRKVCLTCKKWNGKRRTYPRKGSGSFRIETDEATKGYCSHFSSRTDPLYGCPHHVKASF